MPLPFTVAPEAKRAFEGLVADTSAQIADAMNVLKDVNPDVDNNTLTAAMVIVMTYYMRLAAIQLDIDEKDLFDGVREAIDIGELQFALTV